MHIMSLRCQAPTERQLRYKEKVTELRKKRNSSLNKEQKEKHIVRPHSGASITWPPLQVLFLTPCNLWRSTGPPAEPRSEPGAAAGEHHQRLRLGAVQKSAGTCLGGSCKRENSSFPTPPFTSSSLPSLLPLCLISLPLPLLVSLQAGRLLCLNIRLLFRLKTLSI